VVKTGNRTPTPAQYGIVIRDLIAKSGMKHAAVAESACLSAGTLSSLVNGKISSEKAVSQHIDKLCNVFQIERDVLDRRAMYEGEYGLASARFGMNLGETLTLWCSAVGDGTTVLDNKDVQVSFDETSEILIPPSLELLVTRTLQEQAAGKHAFKNNPVLTIFDASWFPFNGIEERPGVNLSLGTTSYALLYALRHTEQGREYLNKALDSWELRQEIDPVLGQGLGVSVVVLTSDGQLMLGRRFSNIGARAEEIDTGAVEGLGVMDVSEDGKEGIGSIDIDAVMKRAVHEEFGITNGSIEDLKILNFGYDIGWAQWNFIGLCQTKLAAKEVQARHKSVAPQRMEYKETYAVQATPETVLPWLTK